MARNAKKPKTTTVLKLWLHMEKITKNEEGEDIDYKNLDNEILPVCLGIYPESGKHIAKATMKSLEQQFFLDHTYDITNENKSSNKRKDAKGAG